MDAFYVEAGLGRLAYGWHSLFAGRVRDTCGPLTPEQIRQIDELIDELLQGATS
jgi:hypothetical protein